MRSRQKKSAALVRPRAAVVRGRAPMKPLLPGIVALLLLSPALARAAAGLADSPSAFVRAQAHGPVQWEPWSEDTLRRARAGNKPVYIFVGDFLSELSRATSRQSFANPETAAYLNQHFVCVLVDREENPALAAAVRWYLQTVKQTDGWPAHVWLTPDLQPYDGAGYLPPTQEWGALSFPLVMRRAGDAWTADPAACRRQAAQAMALLTAPGPAPGPVTDLPARLEHAAAAWGATFDAAHGGFGAAPKSPEPELLRFLLGQSPDGRAQALATLRALQRSPVRDPLDGGFFRRAVDAAWRVPYRQKTLGDQARIALAYLDAAAATGDAALTDAARGALAYARHRLGAADGHFAAAEDATAAQDAGYYVWTAAEIDAALGADAAAFKAAYGVAAAGNVSADDDPSGTYRGRNFLFRATPPGDAGAESRLAVDLEKLRAVRDRRPAPARDERATAAAHGLILAALAQAARQLHDPALLAAAGRTFAFVQQRLVTAPAGDARRFADGGEPAAPADYAALALGCREFARAAHRTDADALADRLLARADTRFFDSARGIYLAAPAPPPPGVFVRAPAAGDAPAAEALALLAGTPAGPAAAMRQALAGTLSDGTAAPGDTLLALQR